MIFIFGTIFGSFLNVVIYRVPKDESIAFPALWALYKLLHLKSFQK
jgi:prepilin signal peptidase PulO-like enzyme (type II secretory pathway)